MGLPDSDSNACERMRRRKAGWISDRSRREMDRLDSPRSTSFAEISSTWDWIRERSRAADSARRMRGVGDAGVVFSKQGQEIQPDAIPEGLGEEVGVIDSGFEVQGIAIGLGLGPDHLQEGTVQRKGVA